MSIGNQEALLGAAERLWAERGIGGASLTDVARAAGLTKGAVYSNFTGKTDLVLAVLERHMAGATAVTPLTVELWLYAMRDFAAGWRMADWFESRRAVLGDQGVLALALELGVALQRLLDPDRVPENTLAEGLRRVAGG